MRQQGIVLPELLTPQRVLNALDEATYRKNEPYLILNIRAMRDSSRNRTKPQRLRLAGRLMTAVVAVKVRTNCLPSPPIIFFIPRVPAAHCSSLPCSVASCLARCNSVRREIRPARDTDVSNLARSFDMLANEVVLDGRHLANPGVFPGQAVVRLVGIGDDPLGRREDCCRWRRRRAASTSCRSGRRKSGSGPGIAWPGSRCHSSGPRR